VKTIHLNHAQHRQLQKLAVRASRVTQADVRFFERFPHRRHRVRLASQAEISQQELLTGRSIFMPEDHRLFFAVRKILPGVLFRLLTYLPEGFNIDLNEATAREIYQAAVMAPTYAELRKAFEERKP
jgi:hypothetical protein